MISVSRFSTNYSSFIIFIFLLTMFSCYLFSTPRGHVQTKKLLHTLRPGTGHWWTGRDLNPRPFGLPRQNAYANRTFFGLTSRQYTRLNYRPQKRSSRQTHLKTLANQRGIPEMLIPVQAPAEKTSGPVAQHGYVARSNAKEHTTDNRGVVNPDDVQSTEFKSLRAHH